MHFYGQTECLIFGELKLLPGQNVCHFTDDICICIFENEPFCIFHRSFGGELTLIVSGLAGP